MVYEKHIPVTMRSTAACRVRPASLQQQAAGVTAKTA